MISRLTITKRTSLSVSKTHFNNPITNIYSCVYSQPQQGPFDQAGGVCSFSPEQKEERDHKEEENEDHWVDEAWKQKCGNIKVIWRPRNFISGQPFMG